MEERNEGESSGSDVDSNGEPVARGGGGGGGGGDASKQGSATLNLTAQEEEDINRMRESIAVLK